MQERMKLFSVTMTEEELRLFSEFLHTRSFSDFKLPDEDEDDIETLRKVPEKGKERLRKDLQPEKILVDIEKEKRNDPEKLSARDYISLAGVVAGAGGLSYANKKGHLGYNVSYTTKYFPETGESVEIPSDISTPLSTRQSIALGGLAGSLIGRGVGYGVEKIQDHNIKKRYRKNPNAPEYEELNRQSEQMLDKLSIAEGKMTREEYAKKHGVKSSKKDDSSKHTF